MMHEFYKDLVKKFEDSLIKDGLYKSKDRLTFRTKQVFDNIDLKNKSLLEIGCGDGVYSIWARLHGAMPVVGLEPEVDGSTSGSGGTFKEIVNTLNLDNIECLPQTIEGFNPNGVKFDIVLSNSSINHLNEDACVRLHSDLNAQKIYLEIFRKIKSIMNPKGRFIILDNSNRNFFGLFGRRSPFAPAINWKKHQPPEVWIQLLKKAGFAKPKVAWCARYKYLPEVLSRKAVSYFFNSFFRLEVST